MLLFFNELKRIIFKIQLSCILCIGKNMDNNIIKTSKKKKKKVFYTFINLFFLTKIHELQ